jgi:hypothetical protein
MPQATQYWRWMRSLAACQRWRRVLLRTEIERGLYGISTGVVALGV